MNEWEKLQNTQLTGWNQQVFDTFVREITEIINKMSQ